MKFRVLILCCMLTLGASAQSYFPSLGGNNSATGPFGAFTGLNQFSSGAVLGPTNFAGLSTGNFASAANGTAVLVTDGTPGSPCTGSGSGALAVRLAGAWLCLPTSSGTTVSIQTDSTPNASQSTLNFTDANGCTWTNPSAGVEEVNCGTGSSLTGSGTNNTLAMWTGSSSLGNSQLSQASGSGGTYLGVNLAGMNLNNRNTGTGFFDFNCVSATCQGIYLQSYTTSTTFPASVVELNDSGQVEITTADSSGNGGAWVFQPGLNKELQFPGTTFANLQAPPSAGWVVYCNNCAEGTNPCSTSGGTGAGTFAFSIGVPSSSPKWKCW
jgi:hypothetical protein